MEAGPLTHSQRIEAINALRTHRSPTFEDLAIGAITGAVVGVIVLGALLWGLGDVPEDRLGWLAVVGGAAGYWIRRFQLVRDPP